MDMGPPNKSCFEKGSLGFLGVLWGSLGFLWVPWGFLRFFGAPRGSFGLLRELVIAGSVGLNGYSVLLSVTHPSVE